MRNDIPNLNSSAAESARQIYPFKFCGTTGEYFKIWIANVLLSAMTVGVYSAWAKVRNQRYFCGNTFVGGANFEYHANPLSILLARIVVVSVVIVGGILAEENVLALIAHSALLVFLLPWAMVRGFAFNARNSSYRGIRFSFRRHYLPLYLIFAPLILLFLIGYYEQLLFAVEGAQSLEKTRSASVFSWLLILALSPWLFRAFHSFKASNHSLGESQFAFSAPLKKYIFAFWLMPMLLWICVSLAVGFPILLAAESLSLESVSDINSTVILISVFVSLPLLYFLITSCLLKIYWNGVSSADGRARINCGISVFGFAVKIRLVNLIISGLSLGLLIPFARIRSAKYLAANMQLEADSALMDEIIAAAHDKTGAFGEAVADASGFDFDVGLI